LPDYNENGWVVNTRKFYILIGTISPALFGLLDDSISPKKIDSCCYSGWRESEKKGEATKTTKEKQERSGD